MNLNIYRQPKSNWLKFDIISHRHEMLYNQVIGSLNMVNHTPPWTHFLNIELIIQIIAIKAHQSKTGLIFKTTLASLPKIYSSFAGVGLCIEYVIKEYRPFNQKHRIKYR